MNVCFIYDPETNERYLEIIRKMTPNRSGVWKDMVAVTDESKADWFVVIDSTTKNVPDDRTLYISAHPFIDGYSGYTDLSTKKHKLDLKETFGFGEWWVKHDYDFLKSMPCPKKEKDICYILSNAGGQFGRDRRKEFAVLLERRGVSVAGRIKGVGHGELGTNTPTSYWFGKEDMLSQHKYSVEVDVGTTKNYFSERFFDSLLMWCMPLCWGCDNIHEYIPKESFRYIDIYGNGDDVIKHTNSGEWERSIWAIAEARYLLLDKYQLWARAYNYIKSL